MSDGEKRAQLSFDWASFPGFKNPAIDYAMDFAERQILFWDTMRQRGNQYREHAARLAPHVLSYPFEVIADGRTFERPVNYGLVRIIPPKGVTISPKARPFLIVDPRAGHGPGIGGFKADSEIGVALQAGHPCYFVGFLPEPVSGQTLEDVGRAEAIFLEKVNALHPEAEGKTCVIGNCQAGWAVMMLAAIRPQLFGPLIIAGSPLSYWAGLRGINPMRYSGGLLGGSWLTALTSDLGAGKFDGAWLVQNFENLNPANTLWSKHYNLYSKVDTEAPRYLEFERWWGGHVYLNADEIQVIVDELFIGNKLAAGDVKLPDGTAIDLRNIRSPIVVFCSKGDNITPPQQALGWIIHLYKDIDEIRSYGQTIVYTVHESAGHLGIFVSSGIARKEYQEFSSNIDLIDMLPPGLYEAKFERKTENSAHADLVVGDWIMRCEPRTLDDIRGLGSHEPEEERMFAAVAQISAVNLAFYRQFFQPFVRATVTPAFADWMRKMHPLRLQYELMNDENPSAKMLERLADQVRDNRHPVSPDNPFLRAQQGVSGQIEGTLKSWGKLRDAFVEHVFLAIYGSPAVQALAGVASNASQPPRAAPKSALHRELAENRVAVVKSRIGKGGLQECTLRGLIYVALASGRVDERSVHALRHFRLSQELPAMTLDEFKDMARDQFFMLLLDTEVTLEAIPALLPKDVLLRQKAFDLIREVVEASGELAGETAARLERIRQLFGLVGATRAALHGELLRLVSKPEEPAEAAETSSEKSRNGVLA